MRKFIALAALLLALPFVAHSQVTYTTSGSYVPLDGATIKGTVSFRVGGCPTGPWVFSLDGTTQPESRCPFDIAGFDTRALSDGAHTVSVRGSSGAALNARFTVSNAVAPAPPAAVGIGKASITWDAPTKNSDGSPLTNLAGYRIYHSIGAVTETVSVAASASQYLFGTLVDGKHAFVVTAVNAEGSESSQSPPVFKTIAGDTPPVCPAQPASETRPQACVAPLVGSWSQQRSYTAVPAPACWLAGTWSPTAAPAGGCALPSPLTTAGPLSYQGSATAMTAVGLVAADLPCGPDTRVVAGVKYCRIVRSQTDFVNWPTDLTAIDIWARAK